MEYTAEQLLEQAQKAIDSYEHGLAVKFMERAFELSPSSDIANQIAISLLELSNQSQNPEEIILNTRTWLEKAIELSPDTCWNSYLYLGQLSILEPAVLNYETGVRILLNLIESTTDTELNDSYRRHVSTALCSLTEIYMSDLCDQPEAESKCEEYMKLALEKDIMNPEVYSTLASVRLSQCRMDEARECLKKNLELWYTEPKENDAIQVDPNWPNLNSRMTIAKLFMECAMYEESLVVLETCQTENDQVVEISYLFGWCYLLISKNVEQEDEKNEFIQDAKECLDNVLKLQEKFDSMGEGFVPPEILCHTQELLRMIEDGQLELMDGVEDEMDMS
ncbi:hypothetical protein BC833DRAFT_602241 [Globomyces pollinis-pini]|nr:hypothetical protein BC833DRAFT_602241 [Globomyces pollinis-pini]